MAKHFLKLNSIVICVDINEKNLDEAINEFKNQFKLSDTQRRLFSYKIDVSFYDQIKALVKQIKNDVGDVTIVVNNAGILNKVKLLTDLSEDEIRRIFDVNILAHFWLC
jgi:all-trans-retinol dehydrogenase (NAD+)